MIKSDLISGIRYITLSVHNNTYKNMMSSNLSDAFEIERIGQRRLSKQELCIVIKSGTKLVGSNQDPYNFNYKKIVLLV